MSYYNSYTREGLPRHTLHTPYLSAPTEHCVSIPLPIPAPTGLCVSYDENTQTGSLKLKIAGFDIQQWSVSYKDGVAHVQGDLPQAALSTLASAGIWVPLVGPLANLGVWAINVNVSISVDLNAKKATFTMKVCPKVNIEGFPPCSPTIGPFTVSLPNI